MSETVPEEGRRLERNACELAVDVTSYALSLFHQQPTLPASYDNGRIHGPKTKWTMEECVHEATVVMYKQHHGFIEPLICPITHLISEKMIMRRPVFHFNYYAGSHE